MSGKGGDARGSALTIDSPRRQQGRHLAHANGLDAVLPDLAGADQGRKFYNGARYEHLPIYKQAMDVAVQFERVVAGFSRYHKYTLGTELRNTSREIVGLIIRANSARDKQAELLHLRERLEALLVLMRLAKEVRAFKSFAAYVHVVEMVGSVSRQNEGWLRSVAKGKVQ